MRKLYSDFLEQCKRAAQTAEFYESYLDVVIVKHKDDAPRISILGNAISRVAYQSWRADGSQVRLLCVFGPNGKKVSKKESK